MSLRGISPTKRSAPPWATLSTLSLASVLSLLSGTAPVLLAQKPTLNTAPAQSAPPAPAAPATQAAPTTVAPTISVEAKLVNIPVIVLDKKGALVQNLTKDNFLLKVDGHDQTVRYFNQDKDLPLTLGLLVDTSQSQRTVLDDERTASIAFLDDMLTGPADRDKAFIVQFAHQTDLLQDVTSSKPKLQEGLKHLDASGSGSTPSFGGGGNDSDSNGGNDSRGHRGGGTTLYDALFLSSDEVQAKQKGRRAVIILSDGVDSGSKESLARSIEAAQRADTIVYAIYYKGQEHRDNSNNNQGHQGGGYPGGGRHGGMGGGGYPGGGGQGRPQGGGESRVDGKKILQRMADETGGRLFEVKGKDTVASIYKQIGEELRAQYRLGYTPDKASSSDGYHRIDISLAPATYKNLFIQTRDGYYTGTE